MNGSEHAPVPRRRHTRSAPEQPAKERRILVSDRKADLVNGLVRRFEQVLRLLDSKVLHVVDEGKARRLLKASFERALWHPRVPYSARHHARLSEVLSNPVFTAAHHRVRVGLL